MLPERSPSDHSSVLSGYRRCSHPSQKLKLRIHSVEAVLESVVLSNSINEGLSGAKHWALVGGVVRDMLLANPSLQLPVPILAWHDIDVAVSKGDLSLSSEILQILDSTINSFGGRKVTSALLGTIDVWSWPSTTLDDPYLDWTQNLNKCDFGVNAVAFAWPLRKVVVHPQWIKDVGMAERGVISIETLTRTASEPIHAVRGIALKCRLAASCTSKQVVLGPKFNALLEDLSRSRSFAIRKEMLDYTKYKVLQGKWTCEVEEEVNRLLLVP